MAQQTTLRTILNELTVPPDAQTEIAKALTAPSDESPWFVSALVGVSAWLSILPFIAFLAAMQIIDSPESAIVIGLLLVIGTVVLHYFQKDVLFLNHLALALNLTGQILFMIGIAIENDVAAAALATWFLEIVLIGFYRDNVLRFLSVLIAIVAALVLLYEFDLPQGIHVLIVLIAAGAIWYWYGESHHLTDNMMASLYQPLGYGFVIGLQTILLLSILPKADFIPSFTWGYSTLGLTVLLLALEYPLLYSNNIESKKSYAIFAGTVLVALLLYQAPGIIASVIVLLLGFQRGKRVLMGLALIFLSVFLIAYYYHLNITLLMKSITLMSAGLALLAVRFVYKRV